MPAKLLYRDAQGQDAAVDIPEGNPIFLGRAADCAVRTDDAMVSRKNCKISYLGGKFFVEDLGSSNGTFLNEKRIQKQQLTHGDVIRCGSLQVRYVEVPGQATTGPGQQQPVRPRTQEINVQAVQPVVSGPDP
jgi:pSer/pThr/pTyr-binding forkhead associated (FHA) protein